MIQVFQIIFSALLLTFSAWLSKKNPEAAGVLIALPLATIIVLPFSYWTHGDAENSVKLAQEILRESRSVCVSSSLSLWLDDSNSGFGKLTLRDCSYWCWPLV